MSKNGSHSGPRHQRTCCRRAANLLRTVNCLVLSLSLTVHRLYLVCRILQVVHRGSRYLNNASQYLSIYNTIVYGMPVGFQYGSVIIKYDILRIKYCFQAKGRTAFRRFRAVRPVGMAEVHRDLSFSIDRGGTFTDVFAEVEHSPDFFCEYR